MKISLCNVDYIYPAGVQALYQVSLEIGTGERVAVVGENGSGKTTLVKHLNGLLRPTRGNVMIGEWNTRERTVAQLSRAVGFLFQNPDEQIFKNRVADEVAFGLGHVGLPASEIAERTEKALERLGLDAERDAHPYDLLPSQRRWVALASVLVMDTPILVLDEPTTGQDAHGLERLARLVHELSAVGKTIIAVTHDMDWCVEHFDRVIVMRDGRVWADGDKDAVFGRNDLLAAASVEPPQVTQIGAALHLPRPVTTVDDLVQSLAATRPQSQNRS